MKKPLEKKVPDVVLEVTKLCLLYVNLVVEQKQEYVEIKISTKNLI